MKKFILFWVLLSAAFTLKAQSAYNYPQFGIGADASYIRGYTNITKQYNHEAYNLNFIYNYNPYIPIVAEIQAGQLSGGGLLPSQDPFGRQYLNKYKALIFHGDVQLGAVVDYEGSWILKVIKNFYLGTGLGLIDNNNTVQRTNVIAANGPLSYVFPGANNSINVMVPLRAGYEFKIFDASDEPLMAIDIGYIHNLVFGSGLDGYNDPSTKFKHNAVDQYRQIVIGFKYFFGPTTLYNKSIIPFGQ